jgi:hypothetical protein
LTKPEEPVAKLRRPAVLSILMGDLTRECVARRVIASHTTSMPTGSRHAPSAASALPITPLRSGISKRTRQKRFVEAAFFARRHRKEKLSIIVPHNDLAVNVEIENSFQQMPGYTPSSFVASFIILRSHLLMARLVGLERSRGRCRVDKWRLWIVMTGCVLISMDKNARADSTERTESA